MTARMLRRSDGGATWQLASPSEDRILEALKKIGAHVDSAVGAFSNLSHLGGSPQTEVALTSLHACTSGLHWRTRSIHVRDASMG